MPESFRNRLDETEQFPVDERERLVSTLLATKWNKSEAASKLHWSRMTLYRKMAKYGIPIGKHLGSALNFLGSVSPCLGP